MLNASLGAVGDVMYVANSKQVGRTRNFSNASPTWISVTGALTGTIHDFALDPFDPYNQAWVVGTAGVWKTTNLDTDPPVWTQILSMQTISATVSPHDPFDAVLRILTSPVKPGYFLIVVGKTDSKYGALIGRTFDYGSTWQWSRLPCDTNCSGTAYYSKPLPNVSAIDMADDGSGRIWLGLGNGSGQPRLHYSADWGATWKYIWGISTINWIQPRNLHIPDRNPGVIYMSRGYSLTQSSDGGYTWVNITPPGAQASLKPRGMAGVPNAAGEFFFVGYTTSRGPVYHSSDTGASFPVTFTTPLTKTPNGHAGNNSVVVTLSATDPKMLAALALPCAKAPPGHPCTSNNNAFSIEIAFSADGGATWSNRIGNWESAFGLWGGASGTSAEHGNVFIQNPKKIEETGELLNGTCTSSCSCSSTSTARHYVGGPIDTASGNYTYPRVDEAIPILGCSLKFERTYSADARDLFTRTLGYGWTHSHIVRLVFPTDPGGVSGQLRLQMPGGATWPFLDQGDGKFTPYFGVTAQMAQITATGGITTYVVTTTNQTVYTFNATGLVTQTVGPTGSVITYTYYPTSPLQSVQSHSRALNFFYDAQDRLARVTDPINRATELGYDANGDLTVVTDTRGLVWTYQYSGTTHLLTRVVDPDSWTVERTEFDGQGRAIRQYDGQDELVVQLEYGSGGVITITDGLNRSSVDRYAKGVWLGGIDAAGQALTRVHGLDFTPGTIVDANGDGTSLGWGGAGSSNLERLTDAAGFSTTMSYDALNNRTRTVDARGFATTYGYSGTLLISQTDALTNTWIYTYGLNNLLVAQHDPLGRVTQYAYNDFGQRTVVTDALGNTMRYEYDAVGRLITTTTALGRIAVNTYDNADHLIAVTNNYTSTSSQQSYLDTFNLVTRYAYDGFGRQVLVTDTLNRVTRSGYDAAGRLVSSTVNYSPTLSQNYLNQYNLVTQYGYDAVGNQTHVTDTLGSVTRTGYDSLNRPVTVTTNYKDGIFDTARPDEDIRRITGYDPAGNAITQTDALDRVIRTWYDKLNRPISVTVNYSTTGLSDSETNLVTQYAYNEVGNTLLVTDTLGRVTRNYYDALGRVVSTTVNYSPTLGVNSQSQYNLTTRYGYDKVGNRVVITDPLTNTTRHAYDALNRVITTTDALTGTTVTVYDAIGNRIKTIDTLGHTTVYTYDTANRLVASTDAAGQTTHYVYDALGNTRVMTDANGNPTLTAYDTLNRVVATTNALSGTTVFGYDALGRRAVMTDANGHATRTTYDGLGRPITMTDALGNFTVLGYDALGSRVKTTDGLGHTTVYTYDTLNRLAAQADPLGNLTRYGYDALGNRVVMTDANGIVTRYDYDVLSRLITVTENYTTTGLSDYQTNLVTRYGYDALGNRTVLTDANNEVTLYAYDAVNRPVAITYTADLTQVQYAYDRMGNRTLMTDSVGVTRYTYDALYRLMNVVDPYGQPITYTYDVVGNRTKLIYPDGKVVTHTYDAANRLTGILDWSSQATAYAYDAASRLITTTLPNGVRTVNTYDDADRLTRLTHTRNGGSETVGDYQYTLDAVGNRTLVSETVTQPGGASSSTAITYTYDPLYRLTDATSSGAVTHTFAYAYDAVDNRTVQTQTITSTLVTTYTYDAADRLTSVNGQVYTWDNNGNLLSDGNRTYTYDQANRLTSISGPGLTWSAVYNGDGARLKQIANGAATTYTLDYAGDSRILAETTAQGTTLYLYGYECLGEYANSAWVYYLNTVAGYVRQTTDASAQIVSAWVFSPDGVVLVGPQGTVSHLVCGGVYDWATGLIYRKGRYFDPALGIWLGLAPLVVVQLWQGRKKQKGHLCYVLLLLVVCVGLTSCDGGPTPTPTPCPQVTPFGPPLGDNAIFVDPPVPSFPNAKIWDPTDRQTVEAALTEAINNKFGGPSGFGSLATALTEFGVSTSDPIQVVRETVSVKGPDVPVAAFKPHVIVYDYFFDIGSPLQEANLAHEMAHYWDQAHDYDLTKDMKDSINWGRTATDRGSQPPEYEDFAEAVRIYFWDQYDEHRFWTDDIGVGRDLANLPEYGGRGVDGLRLDLDQLQRPIAERWPSASGTIQVIDRYDFLQLKFRGN